MNRLLAFIFLLTICCNQVFAQNVVYSSDSSKPYVKPVINIAKPKPPKPPKPITHEWSMGYRLNSNGWGFFTDLGKVRASDLRKADMFHNLLFLQLEFGEKKDPKEQKVNSSVSNQSGGSSSYKYGKINNFYSLKLGAGFQKMLAGKPDPGCISIHWSNSVGFALGLLKPYYINVNPSDPRAIKYSEITQSDFLNGNQIVGSAGFSKGLSEIVFIPGGHFRSALHFDLSTNKHNVVGIETGVNAEFYSSQIQLMATKPAVSGFYDFFIAFQFGKRW